MTERSPRATADAGGRPLWLGRSQRAGAWRKLLGTSEYLVRHIRYGIRDLQTILFTEGRILPPIPQTEAEKEFASADLTRGLWEGIYEEVSRNYFEDQVARGRLVSSSFVVWKADGSERNGRFVVNLHVHRKHWEKGSIKMETLPSFALELEKGDFLFFFDIHAGYRHFYLHPRMHDYFLFHYGGRYYRCIALPLGWGRSPMWFTKFMRGFVQHLHNRHAYRVLPYIDDFLVAAAPAGRPATEEDASKARAVVNDLFDRLGLVRKIGKGCWEGARAIGHLGMNIYTVEMCVFVAERKVLRVRQLSKKILLLAQRNRRLINRNLLEHFCGVCVALSLALPLARFYTRSLYFDMAGAKLEERGQSLQRGPIVASISRAEDFARSDDRFAVRRVAPDRPSRVRLSRQSLCDLRFWRQLTRGEGRELCPCPLTLALHSDVADVGWGGTLGPDLRAGSPGFWEAQRFWTSTDSLIHYASETTRRVPPTPPILLRLLVKPPHGTPLGPRGQPVGGARTQRHGFSEQGNDGGVAQVAETVAGLGRALGCPWASIRSELVHRLAVPEVGSGGRAHFLAAPSCYSAAVQLRPTSIPRSPSQRTAAGADQANRVADAGVVGRRQGAPLEPAFLLPSPRSAEDSTRRGTGRALGSILARAGWVRAIASASDRDTRPGRARSHHVHGHEAPQSRLASFRGQHTVQQQWELGIRAAILDKTGHVTNTGGAEEAARLLSELEWAQST